MNHVRHLTVPLRTNTEALVEAWEICIDVPLPQLVLVHHSYANETGDITNNERLEFLGNSALLIVIMQELYEQYPDVAESDLSHTCAATVSRQPPAAAARRIGLGDFALLGKGESMHRGRDRGSVLPGTFETPIGATYLTSGLEETRQVILERLSFLLANAPSCDQYQNWETILIEYSQVQGLGEVSYKVEGEGPDYQRVLTTRAFISERPDPIGLGQASSKKHAENAAAQDMMSRLPPGKQ